MTAPYVNPREGNPVLRVPAGGGAYDPIGGDPSQVNLGFGVGNPNAGNDTSDLFAQALLQERKRRAQLANQTDASGATTDKAISTLQGAKPTATDAFDPATARFNPDATKGVDVSSVGKFQPTETQGVNFDALSGVDLSKVGGFKSSNLDSLDPSTALDRFAASAGRSGSALSGFNATGFDAGAAVKEYATGAASDFFQNQKLALGNLEAKSVGAGRFRSGLFDKDQGSVITELGRGFTSDLAEKAVSAAGITGSAHSAADATNERAGEAIDSSRNATGQLALGALQSSATARFNKANAQDANALDATKTAASLGITKGLDLGNLSLTRAQTIDQSRQLAGEDEAKFGLQKASTIDTLGLDATKSADALKLDKAKSSDAFNLDRDKAAVTGSQGRTSQLQEGSEASSNRYFDALVGAINAYQAGENAKKANKSNFIDGLIGAGATVAAAAL